MKRFVMDMNMKYVHLVKSFANLPQAYGNVCPKKVSLRNGTRKNVCMEIGELVA
jgi:hypothetical protein